MKYSIFILAITTFLSCVKEPTGNKVIAGKAYYKNFFAQDSSALIPLALQNIYIKKTGDPDENYFDKVNTDSAGNFYFSLVGDSNTVYTKPEIEVTPSVKYTFYGMGQVTSKETSVNLVAEVDTSKLNGFILNIKDSLGGSFAGAKVYLFNNQIIASVNDTTNAIDSFFSDTKGQIFRVNLAVGNYYLNSYKTVKTQIYKRLLKQISIIPPTHFVEDTIVLSKE